MVFDCQEIKGLFTYLLLLVRYTFFSSQFVLALRCTTTIDDLYIIFPPLCNPASNQPVLIGSLTDWSADTSTW